MLSCADRCQAEIASKTVNEKDADEVATELNSVAPLNLENEIITRCACLLPSASPAPLSRSPMYASH